jgi:hypothetical protein
MPMIVKNARTMAWTYRLLRHADETKDGVARHARARVGQKDYLTKQVAVNRPRPRRTFHPWWPSSFFLLLSFSPHARYAVALALMIWTLPLTLSLCLLTSAFHVTVKQSKRTAIDIRRDVHFAVTNAGSEIGLKFVNLQTIKWRLCVKYFFSTVDDLIYTANVSLLFHVLLSGL